MTANSLFVTGYLYSYFNAERTTRYIKEHFDLDMGTPLINVAERTHGEPARFLLGFYTANRCGFHVLEGRAAGVYEGDAQIIECNVWHIFESDGTKKRTHEIKRWVFTNCPWAYALWQKEGFLDGEKFWKFDPYQWGN